MPKIILMLTLICNIGFSQESQYFFFDQNDHKINDFQIALFLNQNITLTSSKKNKVSLIKSDIKAADSIFILTSNNLSIVLEKQAFEKKEIKIDFSIQLDAIEISNRTITQDTGYGRVSGLTHMMYHEPRGKLLRIAVDSLKGSMVLSSDFCFIKSKESKDKEVTITYYYANDSNDIHVVRNKKTVALNFSKRKQWFSIPMNDLVNENNYKYLFIGYIVPGYSEITVGQWKAIDESFIKEYRLSTAVHNYMQWDDRIKYVGDHKIRYPAIRINMRE